ncbi:hypothetical protein H6G89_02915 [Oscillatoria sp. FACHB-1407]|uniref:hypothetical protein n=1 Tax=Oscillatoria sp. FACHB-1407 TaxID=2692847 RepID=UPI00168419B5|nr:hypothetical protein [Oscillatoria sp. FACHB-1407]MBD2459986.1 hypothetical protein [Oscillatoria sp. FACHB-1407]
MSQPDPGSELSLEELKAQIASTAPDDPVGGVPNLLITSVRPPVVPLTKGDGDSRGLVATDLKHYRMNLVRCIS